MRFPDWRDAFPGQRARRQRRYAVASYYRGLVERAEAEGRPAAEVEELRKALRKAVRRV